MTPREFVSQLGTMRFADVFNPYSDRCPVHDFSDAPAQRSEMLVQMLDKAMQTEIDALWVGRDLGFRGGRRTGMALTDDVHFHDHLTRWGIVRDKPTIGPAVSERTAKVIWEMLDGIASPIFLWNVFPLHPHDHGAPFTNRSHNAKERRAGVELLEQLIRLLRPKRLIAIGNDAENALSKISDSRNVVKVRHPSYGGQTVFLQQIAELYGVESRSLL